MNKFLLVLRSALFVLFSAVTVAPFALLCLLWAPLPLHTRHRLTIFWPKMVLWAGRVICGMRWQVVGWENLPKDGRAIVLSKHQSTWETFWLVSWMPRDMCFVFKREILFIPFFGWGIGLLKMIHIDRSKGRDAFAQVVQQGTARLADGSWIVMFPEGTRIPPGKQGKYKTGGSRLALATGAPVIPIAVNSGELWPKGRFVKKPGLITVSIGPPIPSEGETPDSLMLKTERWIETEMRRLSPERYRGPWAPPR